MSYKIKFNVPAILAASIACACLGLPTGANANAVDVAYANAGTRLQLRRVDRGLMRIRTIGYRLARSNAMLCSVPTMQTGLILQDIAGFAQADRLQAMREHALSDGFGILQMVSDSPAIRAGLRPGDEIIGINHAARLYSAARHPKSFISLDRADHLLRDPRDAAYAARVIAGWASRYVEEGPVHGAGGHDHVEVSEIGQGQFQNTVLAGRHRLFADEPVSVGGDDLGPSPYDYLSIALGACKSMTLRMYARHKGIDLGRISVEVRHGKVAADHCEDCGEAAAGRGGRIDRFECVISIDGDVAPEVRERLVEIAGKCPVHKTLQQTAAIVTRVDGDLGDH